MSTTTTVKERPILFSGAMVNAILANRKTQTRRIVKGVPDSPIKSAKASFDLNGRDFGVWFHCGDGQRVSKHNYSQFSSCPYGAPGDRLWVRETWCSASKYIVGYAADGQCGAWMNDSNGGRMFVHHGRILESPGYMQYFPESGDRTLGLKCYGGKWRPSIHMPRWASRITLEVVSVLVERLQEITNADAIAEGCEASERASPSDAYHNLWDQINGAGSWDVNPWVWVVEFKRLTEEVSTHGA